MQIHQHRCGLVRTKAALQRGAITIGFIGGSITDMRPGFNWPEPVIAWFLEKFPGVRVTVENAALGATGSELGVLRAKADLIDRGCDLVFIEFAVNDNGEPPVRRRRTREGLVRKLLAGEGRDLVLTYTFMQPMYADMVADRVPESIAHFEEIGEHYGIGSVWMGLHAMNEVRAGKMRWEEWLPDQIHPQHRGSLSYAQAVNAYLERELIASPNPCSLSVGDARPAPLDPLNWETAEPLPFDRVALQGPWTVRRFLGLPFADYILDTAAIGAALSFGFEGRALTLGFDFGRTSSEFRSRLDGGEWKASSCDRPDWCGAGGWYRMEPIADELPPGKHTFEMEVTHGDGPNCNGTNCRLAMIGIVR